MITTYQFEEVVRLFFAEYVCNEYIQQQCYKYASRRFDTTTSSITLIWSDLKAKYDSFF